MKEIIISKRAPKPLGPYPHARRVGRLLFLSGVGPRKRGTSEIPKGIEAQCRAVFENVKMILEDAGSSLKKLIDVTVFLTNLEKDLPIYNKVYTEYFGEIKPCRTTVGVSKLPGPFGIEFKGIATLE